jgi:DnaJ-like protein
MTEPVAVDVAQFFEFIDRPELAVLLVSIHPRHTFSMALSQHLRNEHQDIALGTINLIDLVTVGGQALPFLHEQFRACDASQFGVLPGYCLFREAEMLAWDAGLPAATDVMSIGPSALVGLVFSAFTSNMLFLVRALHLAVDQIAAPRVALKFKQVASARTHQRRTTTASPPPPIDEVRWAYDVLGVVPTATDREVHQAWRRRRVEMHPDKAAGDADEFARRSRLSVDINRARDIIISHRARAASEPRAA